MYLDAVSRTARTTTGRTRGDGYGPAVFQCPHHSVSAPDHDRQVPVFHRSDCVSNLKIATGRAELYQQQSTCKPHTPIFKLLLYTLSVRRNSTKLFESIMSRKLEFDPYGEIPNTSSSSQSLSHDSKQRIENRRDTQSSNGSTLATLAGVSKQIKDAKSVVFVCGVGISTSRGIAAYRPDRQCSYASAGGDRQFFDYYTGNGSGRPSQRTGMVYTKRACLLVHADSVALYEPCKTEEDRAMFSHRISTV